MSHIVNGKSTMTDVEQIEEACDLEHNETKFLGQGTFALYDGSYTGVGVQLAGWKYPIVINPEDGSVKYDNYRGSWGDKTRLDELNMDYSESAVRKVAMRRRERIRSRVQLEDGSVRIRVQTRDT